MSSRVSRIAKWVLGLSLIGGGATYLLLRKPADTSPVVFKVGRVERGVVEQVVTATGTLSAVVTVQVGSQVSGTILKLFVDFNDRVQAGQIVAQLDPTRFKASLENANANLKSAEASAARARVNYKQAKLDIDRGQTLQGRGVIGDAELDQLRSRLDLAQVDLQSSEAQVEQARAQVGIAKVDLERTTIRSPISGVVLARAVDTGQTVAASLQAPTLFTVAQDLSRMEVRTAIDEADVGKLREGLEARFTVDAYPGEEFTATIFQLRAQPTVTQNVVTYDAILRVENPEGHLRPGMTANVRIVTERRDNVLRVPNAALRWRPAPELIAARTDPGAKRQGKPEGAPAAGEGRRWGGAGGAAGRPGGGDRALFSRVYKPVGQLVQPLRFKPGVADDEYTEVREGQIKEGDEIVIEATGGAMNAAQAKGQNPMRGRGPRMF
ncbi:MAG: efflux RND transporter periplasmic adaptor subunit [Deltaproteobacteria bacterium]|nr:efflux RND transporter periplasmic adaptor subunit [Deltaproteobacteria bacterium]